MNRVLLILSLCIPVLVSGQVRLSVDRTAIRIGDQVKATIQVDLSGDKELINTDGVWPDTLRGVEVVSGPAWNREHAEATTATWSVAFFDTGWVRIPPLLLIVQQQGHSDSLYTNDIPVRVSPVEPDSSGLADIKDIYQQPFSPGYYKRYIPHAVILLLAIAGLMMWLRQRKSMRPAPAIVEIPLLPHEWATKALDELAEKKLWQRGEVKEHYTHITHILREYLERRFGIHAKEQTSDEILLQLRRQQLSVRLLTDTEELLSVADLIKFAKADPGMDIHSATIQRVRTFVAETTPSFNEEITVQSKLAGDEAV